MAQEKSESIKFITPRAIAQWPRLNKPDSGPKGKESKVPKYSIKSVFNAEGEVFVMGKAKVPQAELVAKLEELRDNFFKEKAAELKKEGAKKAALLKKLHKVDVFAAILDDDGNETGKVSFNAKTNALRKDKNTGEMVPAPKPALFDAKGVTLKKRPNIGGGSEVKTAVSAVPYFVDSSGAIGITYYLDGVQLLKLVEYGGRTAESMGFGAEEGYSAAEETEGSGFGDEEGGEDGDGDDDAPAGEKSDAKNGAEF